MRGKRRGANPAALIALMLMVLLAQAASAGGSAAAEDESEAPGSLIVMADFNRDGIADIARVRAPAGSASGPHAVEVVLGQPRGSSSSVSSRVPVGGDPRSILAGDLNGDGNPDVLVGDGDGSLIELLGDGKGHLVAAGTVARLGTVESIAAGDFNHDGKLDVIVSDARANAASVLLGNGDGTFHAGWSFSLPMPGAIFHISVADFNGDGLPDLAVTNEEQDSFEVLLGNGNGTFTTAPSMSNLKDPNAHCAT